MAGRTSATHRIVLTRYRKTGVERRDGYLQVVTDIPR